MGALSALGINLGYLLMQVLGIGILIMVLKRFVYGPMLNVLEERSVRIAKGLEDARQAQIARDNANEEAKKILDAARGDATKARQDAVGQAEGTAKSIEAKANEDAKAIIANAREEAEAERVRILGELRNQVAAVAMAAANKIVGESMDEKRQRALLEDFFAKVPESVSGMKGSRAEVVSALPLTDAEKKQVEKTITADTIDYKVNPNILGGLIVRVDDQVVDNSVANKMSSMSDSLQ